VALGVLGFADPAGAHPLGNVSVNHYAGLVVGRDSTSIDYVLDLAELPTVRETQRIDTDGDGSLSDGERAAYEGARCAELASNLQLTIAGEAIPVSVSSGAMRLLPGAAGLDILRLECSMRGAGGVSVDGTAVAFTDGNPRTQVGWREVTAVGDGVTLNASDVPSTSISQRLSVYPEGRRIDVSGATLTASPGGAAAPSVSPFASQVTAATDSFTSLIASDDVTVPLVAVSLVVAMVFGAVHALAPGHGKSVIAAYLIGQHRDRRMAFLLGGTVAATHTMSVLAFGAFIWLTESIAPERLYPMFGVTSGLLFVALGLTLLRQVVRRRRSVVVANLHAHDHERELVSVGAHDHDHHSHDHGHHHHHDHDHEHGHAHPHEHHHADLDEVASGLGWKAVVLPGLAGGLIPSPSALLVFLGGLALGRAWFGVGLVIGYGIGIAMTLVTAGWLLSRAGDAAAGRSGLGRWPGAARVVGYLPAITAVLVIAGGLHVAFRAALQA
jgi:ABC-type nickel/cobalt efflux system permease component RcnA